MGGSSRCPTCRPLPRRAPGAGWTRRPGYEAQWRRLAEAALELGLGPEQLGETGLDPLAAARAWKPATVALYTQGRPLRRIALPRVATPETDPPELELRPLVQVRSEDPEHLRAVAWCALALAWPAPVGGSAPYAATRCTPPPRLVVATDDGEWAVPGALTAWHAGDTVRDRFPALATSPWVLPALRRGPGLDSQIGGRLSNQALQVTFTKHARRTAQHLRATAAPSRAGRGGGAGGGLPRAVLRLLPPAGARGRGAAGPAPGRARAPVGGSARAARAVRAG